MFIEVYLILTTTVALGLFVLSLVLINIIMKVRSVINTNRNEYKDSMEQITGECMRVNCCGVSYFVKSADDCPYAITLKLRYIGSEVVESVEIDDVNLQVGIHCTVAEFTSSFIDDDLSEVDLCWLEAEFVGEETRLYNWSTIPGFWDESDIEVTGLSGIRNENRLSSQSTEQKIIRH